MASRRNKKLSRAGIALAIGLSGCGVERAASRTAEPATTVELPTTPANRAALERSVEQSLDRLRALELFTVDTLVLKLPENAGQCYGPCPGELEARDAELARQAKRLAAFVDQAEACNSGHCSVFTPETRAEALAALNALEIVHVSALVTVEPKNNPNCYNSPCPADREAAAAETRRRQVTAFTIARHAGER